MNTGAFGEGFPYSNFHDLNMDWIIKIAKDFLDQYTTIQTIISEGETSLTNLTETGLEQLANKADELEELLNQWYETHSSDIANQLADALSDLNTWYTTHENYLNQTLSENTQLFNSRAEQKAQETIATIPDDYTTLFNQVQDIQTIIDIMTLVDKTAVTGAYVDINSGNLVTSSSYYTIRFDTEGYGKLLYKTANTESVAGVAFYDRNGTFIAPGYPASTSMQEISIPWNAKYAQACYRIASESSAIIKVIVNEEKLVSAVKATQSLVTINMELAQLHTGYIKVADGVPQPGDTYRYAEFNVMGASNILYKTGNTESIAGLAFYDKWGNYISSNATPGMAYEQAIGVPRNAYTCKASFRLASRANSYIKMIVTMDSILGQINQIDKPEIIVDINGTGDYTSILEALINTPSIIPIRIRPGTYDLISEYEAHYGNNFFTDYQGYQSVSDPFYRGLWLEKGRKITADAGVTLQCTYTGSNPNVPLYFSMIANTGDVKLENVTLEFGNVRYAIHDDYTPYRSNTIFKDIRFIGTTNGAVIGGGLGRWTNVIIENCVFLNNGNRWDINYHGSNNSATNNKNNIYIRNCKGSKGVGIVANGSATTLSTAYISNCQFHEITLYRADESQFMNMEIIEWCNNII